MSVSILDPDTWKRTGETMPDGAAILLDPSTGLPCVMPRKEWATPGEPLTPEAYLVIAREDLKKAEGAMPVSILDPDTWRRTGETMPDGATILLDPSTGLPCVMPRKEWSTPSEPLTPEAYLVIARDHIERAAPAMFKTLQKIMRDCLALANDSELTDRSHFYTVAQDAGDAVAIAIGADR